MALLDHYLWAVKLYLPKSAQQADILTELSGHLQTKIEDREEDLGRSLTVLEQEEVLAQHGDPALVAARYGRTNLGLAFGRQLISPKVFPLYLRVLLFQFALTIAVIVAVGFFVESQVGPFSRFLVPLFGHFIVTTTIFIAIDAFHRRSKLTSWSFPPPYMQPIPRWQSAAGLTCLGVLGAWWAAIPYVPALIFRDLAGRLALTPAWQQFYWPILLLLVAGAAQRMATLARPDWNWLQAVVRLVTNGVSLALVYPIVRAFPYVQALDGTDAAVRMAQNINYGIWWSVLTGFSFYWLINGGFMLWLCVKHASSFARRRREQAVQGLRSL
jgi:hypothetical protein